MQCAAITQKGTRCPNAALPYSDKCFVHDPSTRDRVAQGRINGGKGKSNARRARKAIPSDLRDVADLLLQAIRDTESGDLETSRASALASLSRAYVAVYEAGLIESKIADIERRIAERVAS
jgi:hypothetical protein